MKDNTYLIQMICNQTGEIIETLDGRYETEEEALNFAEALSEDFAVSCEDLGLSDRFYGKVGFKAEPAI